MGKGTLVLQIVAADGAILIEDAQVTLTSEFGRNMFDSRTNRAGHVTEVTLDAPSVALTQDPYATTRRYSSYTATIAAAGYKTAIVRGIMIFDQTSSIQIINLHPLEEGQTEGVEISDIAYHALDDPTIPEPQYEPEALDPRPLMDVVIPNTISVHLGRLERPAQIVRVPFIEYIKNVASHEIFDAWPEAALKANIYCIVSLTLNRIYTEIRR